MKQFKVKERMKHWQKEFREAVLDINGGEYLKMIGRMDVYRFAELVSRYQDSDNDTYRNFFLRLDPRLTISQMILWAISAWVAMLMIFQAMVF